MKNQRDIIIYSNRGEIRTGSVNLETERVNPALIKKKSPLKWIIIVGISVLLISGVVVGIYFGVKNNKNKKKKMKQIIRTMIHKIIHKIMILL